MPEPASPNPNIVVIAGAAVVIVMIVALSVLVWHGAVAGSQLVTFLTLVATGGVVAGVGHVAATAGARAAARTNDK